MALILFTLALTFFGMAMTAAGLISPQLAPVWLVLSAVCVIAAPLVWLRERPSRLASKLADLLVEGNRLASRVPPADEPKEAMDEAYEAASRWGGRVVDALKPRPTWKALFLDDTSGPQPFATNVPRRSTLTTWYGRRLARLGELLRKLG